MLPETRGRIDAGLPISHKYIKTRLSMLYNFIPRCWDDAQVAEMKEEQRLLRKHKKEMNKSTTPPQVTGLANG